MELPVRKLYIDSRYLSSGNTSNFEYELPEIVNLPKETAAYITEFTCVNGWDTISGSNNQLYIVERNSSNITRARVETLNSGSYDSESLRLEIESKLNAAGKHVAGSYSVARVTSAGANQSSGASYRYYAISLGGGGNFFLPNDAFLRSSYNVASLWQATWNGPLFDINDSKSTNELFTVTNQALQTSHQTGFVDLRSKHSLFVHSPSFRDYQSIGPRGVRTILAKIPVQSAYGSIIVYEHSGHVLDYLSITSGALKTLRFELRDARGNLVDLKGGHWSMTILLTEKPR